jgi:anti-sigma regulatory factor (Ser/Thr protein kinase)
MPLGLMPGMRYEEQETLLLPGESVLLYSDGLVEAHNPAREMFGFPRLEALLKEGVDGMALKEFLLEQLLAFTGPQWEQEDDVTLVILQRAEEGGGSEIVTHLDETVRSDSWRTLGTWSVVSEPGNERQAMAYVAQAVAALGLSTKRLAALQTAVAEATMNAMEHGNHYEAAKPVCIQVLASQTALAVRITDQGGGQAIPAEPTVPDLEAKLAERQSPRGWGLFLIKNLVDEMHVTGDEAHHTLELIVYLEGASHAGYALARR